MTQAEKIKQQIENQQKQKQQSKQQSKAPARGREQKTIFTMLEKMKPEIKKALPKHIKEDRMVRLLMTTLRNNPKLQQADPMTFLAASMEAAQLGLEPNTSLGEAYIIPYERNGKVVAELQLGYKGILKLAQNTGEYKSIYAHAVYPNDEFHYQYGLNKDLVHIPSDMPEGEPTYYYAVYHLKNGGYDFKVMSIDAIRQHRDKFSKARGNRSPWQTDFDSMALKTVLLSVLKYAPKAIEVAKAVEADNTTKTHVDEEMSDVIDVEYAEVREEFEQYQSDAM